MQELETEEKLLLWQFRYFLTKERKGFVKFMRSIDWTSKKESAEALRFAGGTAGKLLQRSGGRVVATGWPEWGGGAGPPAGGGKLREYHTVLVAQIKVMSIMRRILTDEGFSGSGVLRARSGAFRRGISIQMGFAPHPPIAAGFVVPGRGRGWGRGEGGGGAGPPRRPSGDERGLGCSFVMGPLDAAPLTARYSGQGRPLEKEISLFVCLFRSGRPEVFGGGHRATDGR